MSSITRHLTTLCLAAAGAVSPVFAQGGIEFGGFGGYTRFDESLALSEGAGGGARLSVISGYGWSTFVLEAEGAYAQISGGASDLRYIPARARLLYGVPIGPKVTFLLGGGGVRNDYNMGAGSVVEWGYTGLAGFRLNLGTFMSLRADVVVDYMRNPANESAAVPTTMNQAIQAGLHFPLWTDKREPPPRPIRPSVGSSAPQPVAPTAAPVMAAPPASAERGPDADRDGVSDSLDACSNTPPGASVDVQGCPVYRDSDGDGIIDPRDACPATATGAVTDVRGCPVVADSDNDGIANTVDRCPTTIPGERVDATGCAIVIPKADVEVDTDNDGVIDARDRCPNTAAGTQADATGCPINIPKPAERGVTLRGVTFASGRDALTPSSYAVLDQLAEQLLGAPSLRLEISGHTDATGSRATNLQLSLARAEAVRAYLVLQGVPGERLVATGYGPDMPIANNRTAQGRAMNRRVELRKIN